MVLNNSKFKKTLHKRSVQDRLSLIITKTQEEDGDREEKELDRLLEDVVEKKGLRGETRE